MDSDSGNNPSPRPSIIRPRPNYGEFPPPPPYFNMFENDSYPNNPYAPNPQRPYYYSSDPSNQTPFAPYYPSNAGYGTNPNQYYPSQTYFGTNSPGSAHSSSDHHVSRSPALARNTSGSVSMSHDGSADAEVGQGSARRAHKWDKDSNILLTSSWINTSKDAVIGTDQTAKSFWSRVAVYFNENTGGNKKVSGKQCKDHWNKMNPKVTKFHGAYNRVKALNRSGWSEEDVFRRSLEMYESENNGSAFQLDYIWRIVKLEPKWNNTYCPDDSSSKRCKNSESGAYTSSSNRDEDGGVAGEEVEEVRPEGQKAAKRKGKSKKNPEDSFNTEVFLQQEQERLEHLKKLVDIQERNLVSKNQRSEDRRRQAEDRRREAEAQQKSQYMQFLMMDTSNFTPEQLLEREPMVEYVKQELFRLNK